MGRRPVQNKKTPAEYPQIAFRISNANKKRLSGLIDEVQARLNDRRGEDDPFINKNDVFVLALDEGLKVLKRK